jgi:hypothetical protein
LISNFFEDTWEDCWTLPLTVLGLQGMGIQHFLKRADKDNRQSLMNNGPDKTKGIMAQLQQLQIRESELLQRLERISEVETPTAPRVFAIGDLVIIKNPRPFQSNQGKIIKIGVGTNRTTVKTKNGSKIVWAPFNLAHLD